MADFQVTDKTLLTSVDRAADSLLIYDNSALALKRTTTNYLLDLTSHPVGVDDVQVVTSKTVGITNTVTLLDTLFTLQDNSDNTKQAQFQLSGITTGTTRTYTLPNASSTLVDLTSSQTLSGKTLTGATITAPTITNPTLSVDTVSEFTSTNGVTIDGLNIKDSKLNTNNSVVTANITDASVTAPKLETSINPVTRADETIFDHVASGFVWAGDSYGVNRNASMTPGTATSNVAYIDGYRGTVGNVTARTFTASRDTYIDILNTAGVFTLVYTEVTNNNTSPALAANSIRIGIIITGATTIAAVGSVNQGQEDKILPIVSSIPYAVTDSLGNLICPRDPSRKLLGARRITTSVSQSSTTPTQITGLSVPVIIPTGRKIKVSFVGDSMENNTLNSYSQVNLYEGAVGGTQLMRTISRSAVASMPAPVTVSRTYTPTSTNLTYNASLNALTSGTAMVNADPTFPAAVIVELL